MAAMKVSPARAVALELLNRVFKDDAYANLLMPSFLAKAKLTDRDAAFAQELAFSTVRWKLTYDAIINEVSSRSTESMDIELLNCLRLGAHQLLNMRVPAHAALSETVELVRNNCGEKVVGFTNGVLRTISRSSFETWLDVITKGLSETKALSLRYSHPEWIVLALKQSLMTDGLGGELDELLNINNQPAAVNLVALPGLEDRSSYLDQGVENQCSPFGFSIKSGNPADLAGFSAGGIRVQDEGSQIAALALTSSRDVAANEKWLDMCAGPGGKAALLAALAKTNGAHLTANEPQTHRAHLVREALKPFNSSTSTTEWDGRDIGTQAPNTFDRILVDAPCSGLGALRRRPEARWRKSNAELKDLTVLQFQLLESAAKALKPGGLILYVTCSPHLAETTAIIDKASRQLGLEVLDLTSVLNEKYFHGVLPKNRKTVQLHTQRDNTDSMFMALLTKR